MFVMKVEKINSAPQHRTDLESIDEDEEEESDSQINSHPSTSLPKDPYEQRWKNRQANPQTSNLLIASSSSTSSTQLLSPVQTSVSKQSSSPSRKRLKQIKVEQEFQDLKQSLSESDQKIPFISGNPNVEEIIGIIHLYQKRKIEEKSIISPTETNSSFVNNNVSLPTERSTIVCVLAVPSFMSIKEFYDFISCMKEQIKSIKIVRDNSPNKYMILLQFQDQESADSFYMEYNGRPFNSLDPEECKLVFVSKVEFVVTASPSDTTVPPTVSPIWNSTLSSATVTDTPTTPDDSASDGTRLFEIPTCPVCLERLDPDISGIVTTICNHKFHCECLTKWGDSSCPVCRYSQDEQASCSVCGNQEDLWICLTCGNIGCSRYQGGHARKHFLEANHTYAMELSTKVVWDYSGDAYVHRLIQSKTGGKLVEVTDKTNNENLEILEAQYNSKVDDVYMQYNNLLTSQLESQRKYFENLLQEKDNLIESVQNEKTKQLKQIEKQNQRIKKLEEENVFNQKLNQALLNNEKAQKQKIDTLETEYKKKLEEKNLQIKDLQEQINELLLNFEVREKLQSQAAQGAHIIVQETPVPLENLVDSPSNRLKKRTNKK